jgi:hypothetical protein
LFEFLRIKGKIRNINLFGLRRYEERRPASYIYFGTALYLLLFFFPQQIAIPCILCACFSDPILGEIRHQFTKKTIYFIGLFLCMCFFLLTWYAAELWVLLFLVPIGGVAAVIGETVKFEYIDDDFMIQILPAIIIMIIWQGLLQINVNILPDRIILPL